MHQPASFTVHPSGSKVIIQGRTVVGEFDPATGFGVLNWKGGTKTLSHLKKTYGAVPFQFPDDFVIECLLALKGE